MLTIWTSGTNCSRVDSNADNILYNIVELSLSSAFNFSSLQLRIHVGQLILLLALLSP